MLKTNEAFKKSLAADIAYLAIAMRRPLVDVDYSEFEGELLAREAEKLRNKNSQKGVQATLNKFNV